MILVRRGFSKNLGVMRDGEWGQGKDYPGDFKRLDIDFLGICDI